MAKFHEQDLPKWQIVIGYVLSILFSFQILMAGVLKLFKEEGIMERMSQIPNWEDKVVFVGVLELAILILYWVPKTQKLGFYLLASFMGGVIVAKVAAGNHEGMPPVPLFSLITTILLYAGTFMRKPSLLK